MGCHNIFINNIGALILSVQARILHFKMLFLRFSLHLHYTNSIFMLIPNREKMIWVICYFYLSFIIWRHLSTGSILFVSSSFYSSTSLGKIYHFSRENFRIKVVQIYLTKMFCHIHDFFLGRRLKISKIA